jgi:two-component system LytT family response regulator
MLKLLIVDDEEPARQRLRDLLAREEGVGPLLEAGDGESAAAMILAERPDLVFLDIQMPGVSGIEVVDFVGIDAMPPTVFVTAYDQYAIRAFDANAIDYLLKPFSDERFESAMVRARARVNERATPAWGARLLQMVSDATSQRPLDRLVVKVNGATRFLRTAEIDRIEAAGVYVTLHADAREFLYRASLTEMAVRLDPRLFVRIHRSTLVNIDRIEYLAPISHGEFEVVLKSGARLKLSRTYRGALEQRLGQPL